MFLESIYSKKYDMPIACYKNKTTKLGGTTFPTSNHFLEDPEPMVLLPQLVDHAQSDRPSPYIA